MTIFDIIEKYLRKYSFSFDKNQNKQVFQRVGKIFIIFFDRNFGSLIFDVPKVTTEVL